METITKGSIVEITVVSSKKTFRQWVKLTRDAVIGSNGCAVLYGYRYYNTGRMSDDSKVYVASKGCYRPVGR